MLRFVDSVLIVKGVIMSVTTLILYAAFGVALVAMFRMHAGHGGGHGGHGGGCGMHGHGQGHEHGASESEQRPPNREDDAPPTRDTPPTSGGAGSPPVHNHKHTHA